MFWGRILHTPRIRTCVNRGLVSAYFCVFGILHYTCIRDTAYSYFAVYVSVCGYKLYPCVRREQAHPPTEPRGSHTRSLFREAMGHCSPGHPHSPHGAGSGAGCALSRPSWTATLAHRPRSSDNQGHFVTPAASSVHQGDPTSSPRRHGQPRPCHWPGHRCRRLVERSQPSWPIRVSVLIERAAAVHEQAEH